MLYGQPLYEQLSGKKFIGQKYFVANFFFQVCTKLAKNHPAPVFFILADILAVGGEANSKAELMYVERNSWVTISDYPYVEEYEIHIFGFSEYITQFFNSNIEE